MVLQEEEVEEDEDKEDKEERWWWWWTQPQATPPPLAPRLGVCPHVPSSLNHLHSSVWQSKTKLTLCHHFT